MSSGIDSSGLQYARQVSALGVPGSDMKILIDKSVSFLSCINLARYSSADRVMLIYLLMFKCGY